MPTKKSPDELFMRRAIALSKRGFPAPNPHVGCVLARDGEIIGEGYHHYAGGPHAEAVALSVAGDRANAATAYVTLEPCNHHGRTPPCSEALINAGVARVVFAVSDPNPRAVGGAERMQAAGVAVEAGMLEAEAREANRRWLAAMSLGRPYVVAKAAVSADGRIALPSGESQWITGERARGAGHRLRAELGAVLVGSETVLKDDPQLTARIRGVRNQPLRVVLDGRGRLTGTERLFADTGTVKWIVGEPKNHPAAIQLSNGVDGFEPEIVLSELWRSGETGLLIEGGANTISRFVAKGLVDEIQLFLAPKLLGSGPTWLGDIGLSKLSDAHEWSIADLRRVGSDARVVLRRTQ